MSFPARQLPTLEGARITLRPVLRTDLNESYVGWMNDIEVSKFTDIRFNKVSHEDLIQYWERYNNSSDNPWFAICLSDTLQHIGNIKLGPINSKHSIAPLSLFIGDRNSWGKGYATTAIKMITHWSFEELKLFKLYAYIYKDNIASIRAFQKAGYRQEALYKDDVYVSPGKRTDLLRVALSYPQWIEFIK